MKYPKKQKPPVIASFLLEKALNSHIKNGAIGDIIEQYFFIQNHRNRLIAWLWFWAQILQIVPAAVVNKMYWSPIMLKNYILVAFRNLKKQKIYSFINIIGLAIGMTGFALFAHFAGVKLNSDKFHDNADRIFSVIQVIAEENRDDQHTTYTPSPLQQALQNDFPEIEAAVRVFPAGRMTLKRNNDIFYENQILLVDPTFLSIFSFKLISGDRTTALEKPNSIILTKTAAQKYFGEENPIGKILTLEKKIEVTVIGIIENISRTSSLRFDFLASMETRRGLSIDLENRTTNSYATFLLLRKGIEKNIVNEKLPAFIQKYWSDSREAPLQMYLFPFLDIRLKSMHINSFMASSHPAAVFIFFFIGILLLLVVSINYINLSTARSMHRNREIGIRKVIGARRSQLIVQLFGESLILSFIALPCSVILYELAHPYFTNFVAPTGSVAVISNSIFNYPFLLKYLFLAALLTGLLSGIYPALFLSSYKPVQVLTGNPISGHKKRLGSKVMIVFQFSMSIILILFASIVSKQKNSGVLSPRIYHSIFIPLMIIF